MSNPRRLRHEKTALTDEYALLDKGVNAANETTHLAERSLKAMPTP